MSPNFVARPSRLCFLCAVLCIVFWPSHGALLQQEYDALHELYVSTNGDNWAWQDDAVYGPHWDFTSSGGDPCSPTVWQGLICNGTAQNCSSTACSLNELSLSTYNLDGQLPSTLGDLMHLQSLIMSKNSIDGPIPTSLCKLSNLVILELDTNGISGTIPSCLGENLRSLGELWLFANRLEGSIPSTVGMFSEMKFFSVANNHLEGVIPEELWQMTKLINLQVYSNTLTGTLSSRVGSLVQLQRLYVMDNLLSQSLPSTIGSLSSIIDFYVYQNEFTNVIPSSLCDLTSANVVAMFLNQLSGPIPSCTLVPKATYFDISRNALTGSIPAMFGNNMTAVNFLYIDVNYLTGNLPESLSEISRLSVFFADTNLLTGPIPDFISKMTYLSILDLSINKFHGTIPEFLYDFSRLKGIAMHDNILTGTVSPSIGKLSNTLELILLNGNHMHGSIPSSIGGLTKLTSFQIQHCSFTGTIPTSFGTSAQPLPLLKEFMVGYNHLSGTIPSSLGNIGIGTLSTFNVRDNMFSGTLPATLFTHMTEVSYVELCNNRLSGTLPSSMGSLLSLGTLLLQNNKFEGKPTTGLNKNMTLLTAIDMSENRFSGTLPALLFEFEYIAIVAAAKNCFSGELPDTMCRPTALVTLVLDGLSSAESCADRIPYTPSYWTSDMVHGEIPPCLLSAQPFLALLHISGNALTGNFLETDISNSTSKLATLVVAHNRLSGTISQSIQRKPFLRFDASYNRITGTIDEFGADMLIGGESISALNPNQSYVTTSIKLNENRLSGHLPSSFKDAKDIDVLNGNLFQCSTESTPNSDPAAEEYICGSDDLDAALISWGVCAVAAVFLYATVVLHTIMSYRRRDEKNQAKSMLSEIVILIQRQFWLCRRYYVASKEILTVSAQQGVGAIDSVDSSDSNGTRTGPIPGKRSLRFLQHLRINRNSCLYISAVILFIYGPLCILLKSDVIPGSYGTYLRQASWVFSALFQGGFLSAIFAFIVWCLIIIIFVCCNIGLMRKESLKNSKSFNRASILSSISLRSVSLSTVKIMKFVKSDVIKFSFTLVLNCCLVLGVNLAYVYGMINDTSSYSLKIGLRLLLICFNAVWGNGSISLVHRVFPREIQRMDSHSIINLLLILIPMFNTVLAPVISAALLDDSCFKRLLTGDDEITATYTYLKCTHSLFELYEDGRSDIKCVTFEPTGELSTTFESSYYYSYSCSSSLMKLYLPALLAGYLVKCCLGPILYSVLLMVGRERIPERILDKLPVIVFPELLRLKAKASHNDQTDKVYVFDAIKAVAFMRNHLTVLMTFGVASPPLAVAICVTAVVQEMLWRCLVGRYLILSGDDVEKRDMLSIGGGLSFTEGDRVQSDRTGTVEVGMTPLGRRSNAGTIESEDRISEDSLDETTNPMSPHAGASAVHTSTAGGLSFDSSFSSQGGRNASTDVSRAHIAALDNATARCCLAVGAWARLTLFASLLFFGWIIIDISGDDGGVKGSVWVLVAIAVFYVLANAGLYFFGKKVRRADSEYKQ